MGGPRFDGSQLAETGYKIFKPLFRFAWGRMFFEEASNFVRFRAIGHGAKCK